MENLHLLRPYMLLLLIPALLALVFLLHRKKSQNNWNKICDSHLLKHLSVDVGKTSTRLSLAVLALMWIVAVVAASGPAWRQAPQPAYRNQSAVVVALDLSYSMLAQDIKPSRIERAKYKVIDLLEKEKDRQLSLVVFAGDAHAVTPLTDDINTIKAQIEPLDPMIMPFPGSRPDQGVTKALELLKNGAAKNGEIILLTDGTEGYWQQLEDVAADVNAAGHTLAVIGVGTSAGAPIPAEKGGFIQDKRGAIVLPKLDKTGLKKVALEGGGQYVTMTADDMDINTISKFSLNKKQIDKEKKQQVTASWSDDGYWLVFLLIPIALYCFRKGVVFSFILALMVLPSISHSAQPGASQGLWSKLWKNQQQLGVEQFNSGEYESAEQNLQGDTLWKSAAQYRAGKFEDALKTLEGDDSSQADYNRGNALAHMERYEEAIAAYTQALEKDPENRDAKHNKELLEKHLQQQEQQSDNQDQSGEKGENQEGENQEGQNQKGENQEGENQQSENQQGEQSQQQSGQQDDSQHQEPEQQQDLTQSKQDDSSKDQEGKQGQESQQEKKEEQEKQAQKAEQQEENAQQQDNSQQMMQEDSQQQVETKPLDQKTEQWLRQIPDNPGGLLKRKFYYESKKKYDKGTLPNTKNRW